MAIVISLVVIFIFYYHFHIKLNYPLSSKPSDWVDFSDYIGGTLGTTFSFLSFIFLLHSLKLQNIANKELHKETKVNRKNEKFRHFESHFFNLLEAQRSAFEKFKFQLYDDDGTINEYIGVEAVVAIENCIEEARDNGSDDAEIKEFLLIVDESEKIYNTMRIFNNMTKMISTKLSEENGFTYDDRKSQLETLITFTEFSQLRLVLISMQFMELPPARSLRNNNEFISLLTELGLNLDPY